MSDSCVSRLLQRLFSVRSEARESDGDGDERGDLVVQVFAGKAIAELQIGSWRIGRPLNPPCSAGDGLFRLDVNERDRG